MAAGKPSLKNFASKAITPLTGGADLKTIGRETRRFRNFQEGIAEKFGFKETSEAKKERRGARGTAVRRKRRGLSALDDV